MPRIRKGRLVVNFTVDVTGSHYPTLRTWSKLSNLDRKPQAQATLSLALQPEPDVGAGHDAYEDDFSHQQKGGAPCDQLSERTRGIVR